MQVLYVFWVQCRSKKRLCSHPARFFYWPVTSSRFGAVNSRKPRALGNTKRMRHERISS